MNSDLWGPKDGFSSEYQLQQFYAGYQSMEYLAVPSSVRFDGSRTKEEEFRSYVWCSYNLNTTVALQNMLKESGKSFESFHSTSYRDPVIDGLDFRWYLCGV
ncbi:hypothetical protein WICPIJ_009833 [Wickerhamomyces pijperi]|uniref:Uncharacterized protein n=1 Tax=Wickerhamomyces pijperi TaxID=599730 RepID=A0A9P8TBU6_WICPI|nr:hypothetical protein WICPIJ_009833 [Wickerhamomyces pijperi]